MSTETKTNVEPSDKNGAGTSPSTQNSTTSQVSLPFFTWSDQKLIAVICLMLGGWVAIRAISLSNWRADEIEIRHQEPESISYILCVNEANWLEFSLLEGIGEVLGKRIVAERQRLGGFTSLEQLNDVKGIGPKTYARIRPHLTLEPTDNTE